jgi:hypothetical protein
MGLIAGMFPIVSCCCLVIIFSCRLSTWVSIEANVLLIYCLELCSGVFECVFVVELIIRVASYLTD